MAVPEQTPYIEHTGNGVTTSFSLGFQCESKDHLIVLMDEIEPPIATWSLSGGNVVFATAPAVGKKIKLQRNTPFGRTTNYQSFNNSFRPQTVNIDFDRIWWKLQELGVADWLMKLYVDRLHQQQEEKINNLKGYVDDRDDELRAYLMEEIRKQGVALDQLDDYYNYLMQRLAQIAVDRGWDAAFVVDASGKNQQEINDHFDSKLKREMVSVWDFFTKAEQQAYNLAIIQGLSATYDSHRPLNEFFDYIAANDVGTAYCSGTFYTTSGILLGGASGCATKEVIGKLNIRAMEGSAGHTLFAMQCGQDFKWFGSINPMGLGGGIFNNRSWRRGLVLGGEHQCAHTYINSVYAYGFSEYGVLLDNLTTSSDIADIRVTRCGSGYKLNSMTELNNTWSDKSAFVKVSDNITVGSTQNSVIRMDKMPLTDLRFNPILYINGELYHVNAMNYDTMEITIFPLLNTTINEGVARYVYGAGVCTAGSDASTVRMGKLNSTNCSVIYHSGALYPATIYGTQTGQSNFIDVLLGGNTLSQAHVGGAILSLYCEDSVFNIVRRTRTQLNYAVLTNVALNIAKIYDLSRVRNADTNELDKTSIGLDGVLLAHNGHWLSKENRGVAANDVKDIDVTDINRSEYWHYGTSKTFNILAPNMPRLELLGYNRKSCILMGNNNAGNPTGDVVFNAPAGYTVNGQPSVTFNGFTQAAKFDVYLQYIRNNFIVTCTTLPPTSNPSASVTYDPELLAPNEIKYQNVTLNGAKLGDAVVCSFSRALNGTRIWAEVTGANIVTVYHQNPTANPVDLTSGTLSVKLV